MTRKLLGISRGPQYTKDPTFKRCTPSVAAVQAASAACAVYLIHRSALFAADDRSYEIPNFL